MTRFSAALFLPGILMVSLALSHSEAYSTNAKTSPRDVTNVQQSPPAGDHFCANIQDIAREKRYALKASELKKLKVEVEARIVALEEKRAEFEAWKKQRDDFADRADSNLVEIYSKMRPDAAAGRLEMLPNLLAAAILLKISPRKASVILNEMKAEKAAGITKVIASSSVKVERSL